MKYFILIIPLLLCGCSNTITYKSVTRSADGKCCVSELVLKSNNEFSLTFMPEWQSPEIYYSYGKYSICRNQIHLFPQKKDFPPILTLKRKHRNKVNIEVFACGNIRGGDAIYEKGKCLGETDTEGLFSMKRPDSTTTYTCVFFLATDSINFDVSSRKDSANYYKISKQMGCQFFSMRDSIYRIQGDSLFMNILLNDKVYDLKYVKWKSK